MHIANLAGADEGLALGEALLELIQRLLNVDLCMPLLSIGVLPELGGVCGVGPRLVILQVLVRDGGDEFVRHDRVKGAGAADVREGEDLVVEVDLASGREGLADRVRLDHGHPEELQQKVIRRRGRTGVICLRPEQEGAPGIARFDASGQGTEHRRGSNLAVRCEVGSVRLGGAVHIGEVGEVRTGHEAKTAFVGFVDERAVTVRTKGIVEVVVTMGCSGCRAGDGEVRDAIVRILR